MLKLNGEIKARNPNLEVMRFVADCYQTELFAKNKTKQGT